MNRLDPITEARLRHELLRSEVWANCRPYMGDASRPALPPLTGPSLLRVSGIAGIAIAAFTVLYFLAQLVRGVL